MDRQYDYETRYFELSQSRDATFNKFLLPFVLDSISEYIEIKGPAIDILDVGCGCGYLTQCIAKEFPQSKVEGIDSSEVAIACAENNCNKFRFKLKNVNFKLQDVVNLHENRKYDAVVYNMVLHNLSELEKTISKTSNILKENGIVVITMPHPAFWMSDKITRGKITLTDPFNYNLEKTYKIPFQINHGSRHHIELTYYHRRLTTYLNIFSRYLRLVDFQEVDFKDGYPTMLRIVLEN